MPYQKIDGYNGNMYGDNRRASNDMLLQSKLPLEDFLPGAPKPQPRQPPNYGHDLPPLPASSSLMPGSMTVTSGPEVTQYPNIPSEYAGLPVVESYTPPSEAAYTPGDPAFRDSFDLIEGIDDTVTITSTKKTRSLHPVVILVVLLLLYFSLKYWGDALDSYLTTTFFAGQTPSWKASVVMAVIFTVIIIGVLLIFNISVPVLTREISLT